MRAEGVGAVAFVPARHAGEEEHVLIHVRVQQDLVGGAYELKQVDSFMAVSQVNTVLIVVLQELLDLHHSALHLRFETQLLPHHQRVVVAELKDYDCRIVE